MSTMLDLISLTHSVVDPADREARNFKLTYDSVLNIFTKNVIKVVIKCYLCF